MKITHESGDKDAWVCLCGNTPSNAGFYPVNNNGEVVEPTYSEWNTNNYVCSNCGRIIDMNTLEVVNHVPS